MISGSSWDDLRYLLAVARHGSLSAAARVLGVNHSTVLRRVTALEEAMGARLFDKLPGGYVLTAAGDEMQRVAQKMEEDLAAANRLLSGRDTRISGSLRVTTVDILTGTRITIALPAVYEPPAEERPLQVEAAGSAKPLLRVAALKPAGHLAGSTSMTQIGP
ncbi:LysR family transcriptional regulator [Azospirillum sp. B506]|uniref:LysR family transcriptional regulator n=1 Tax=Azospirillum sp. B506 TaxID=137721 RepID=UPI00034D7DB8|nr:LysR family transcriptional regulator [Azospirillum sp. B506]